MDVPTLGYCVHCVHSVHSAHTPRRLFSPTPHPHLPLYTPYLWRHSIHSMEVDFQAIKVEELKSRLGELRRYL